MSEIKLRKPSMDAICQCGHLFEEHDWGLQARRRQEAGCLVKVGRRQCYCENFIKVGRR